METQDVQFNAALVRSDKALLELAGILEATRSGWQSKVRHTVAAARISLVLFFERHATTRIFSYYPISSKGLFGAENCVRVVKTIALTCSVYQVGDITIRKD